MSNISFNQMVNSPEPANLSYVFYALSDPIRREIIGSLGRQSVPISAVASLYHISLVAVSKHITILERAGLVRKYRSGRGYKIALQIKSLQAVEAYVHAFTLTWDERYDRFKKNMEQRVLK